MASCHNVLSLVPWQKSKWGQRPPEWKMTPPSFPHCKVCKRQSGQIVKWQTLPDSQHLFLSFLFSFLLDWNMQVVANVKHPSLSLRYIPSIEQPRYRRYRTVTCGQLTSALPFLTDRHLKEMSHLHPFPLMTWSCTSLPTTTISSNQYKLPEKTVLKYHGQFLYHEETAIFFNHLHSCFIWCFRLRFKG